MWNVTLRYVINSDLFKKFLRWENGVLQTASVRHNPLGASSHQETSDSKHLHIKDPEQGQFKVVRENSGYCVQCTLPIIFTIFQKKI